MKKSMTYICIFLTIFLFNIIEVNAANAFTCIYYDKAGSSETIAFIQNSKGENLVLSNVKTAASYTDNEWIHEVSRIRMEGIARQQLGSAYLGETVDNGYEKCPDSVTRKDGFINFYGGDYANKGKLKRQKTEIGSDIIKKYNSL